MRINTSDSEKMVVSEERLELQVLPQVEEFIHLRVLFTSVGRMEQEIDRRGSGQHLQ